MSSEIDEYFKSAFQDKLLVKMPEREDDHLTPATRLLEKRREMAEVEQSLIAQKEEFQMKMESLQQRREELERKEFQLKESLLKFDKFLKENDAKRARYVKRATDERELRRQKEREIEKLKEETRYHELTISKLQQKIDRYEKYQKFMEGVLEQAEDFQEVREITGRYETLTSTFEELVAVDKNNEHLLEAKRMELAKYIEAKHNEIMAYNNQLATLQFKLDKAQSKAKEWEDKWTQLKNTSSHRTLQLGKLKMAAHNLYQLMIRQGTGPPQEPIDDTFEQLDKVKEYIITLTEIISDITKPKQSKELKEVAEEDGDDDD